MRKIGKIILALSLFVLLIIVLFLGMNLALDGPIMAEYQINRKLDSDGQDIATDVKAELNYWGLSFEPFGTSKRETPSGEKKYFWYEAKLPAWISTSHGASAVAIAVVDEQAEILEQINYYVGEPKAVDAVTFVYSSNFIPSE